MVRNAVFAGLCLSTVLAMPARAEAPLSAIDWLSESVAIPAALPPPEEPAVTGGADVPGITVSVLNGASPDAAGVLAPSVTGLPPDLWGLGLTDDIIALIDSDRSDALPALTGLVLMLLLAEAEPPADAAGSGRLLLARVDKLLSLGALDQAQALIAAAGDAGPDLFRRSFDVAMLTGSEDRACVEMRASPTLAPTFPARVFCLARSGDWNAAALTLRTGQALGHITAAEDALLSRFLDPDLYEGEPPLDPPSPVTPLAWRMLEAVGEPLPTAPLPLAFSHADLRDTAGWKSQVEAAERLVRVGVIEPNLLLGLYTEREPAASGTFWDRVDAFQRADAALLAGDTGRIAATLPTAWAAMAAAELEVPFARLYGARLVGLGLLGESTPPETASLAFRIALLSPEYERAALAARPQDATGMFLAALAKGDLTGVRAPDSLARAIAPAFLTPDPGPDLTALIEGDRLGEAILSAIDGIRHGVQGDPARVTQGLSLLRQVGLEDVARRTALELMLLERRG